MSEFKPTPGEWYTKREGFSTIYVFCRIGGGLVQEVAACGPTNEGQYQQEDNAKLIIDAGNTYHATGMTPSQLAERVKVLEDALREIAKDETTVYDDHDGCDCIVSMCTEDMIAVAEKALAK